MWIHAKTCVPNNLVFQCSLLIENDLWLENDSNIKMETHHIREEAHNTEKIYGLPLHFNHLQHSSILSDIHREKI